ncbi:VanZ family protein [Streptomyces araujoniae]|uniref:VanZ family protein n=1 Tax=Streptomyces sp. ZEA17I TaxID=2202516 RepID=UPI00215AABFD|nr:VanZ family protein [Streptomyces sp. ZEA17I]
MIPNIIMFLPLGCLLPLLRPRISPRPTVLASAIASLSIESLQMLQYVAFGNGRAVDINDVIANTLGGFLGYAPLRTAKRATSTRALDRLTTPTRTTA